MPAPDPAKRIEELESTLKSVKARLEEARAEKVLFERSAAQRVKERDEARKERDELRKQLGAQTALAPEPKKAEAPKTPAVTEAPVAAPELPKLADALRSSPPTSSFQKELVKAKSDLAARDQRLSEVERALESAREREAQVELDLAAAESQIADLAAAATAREAELALSRAETKKLRETIAELERAPRAPLDPERTFADIAGSATKPALTTPEVKVAQIDALLSEVVTQAMGRVQPKKEAGPPRVAGRLSVIEGPSAGQRLVVMTGATVTIGRGAEASYSFHDIKLSRKHCVIEDGAGKLWLRDLGSQSGTLHNGRPVDEKVELAVGDKVRLGSSVLEVTEIRAGAASPAKEKKDETPAEGSPIPSIPDVGPTKDMEVIDPTKELEVVGPTKVMDVFAPPPTAELFSIAEEQAERTTAVAPMTSVGTRCDGCRTSIAPGTARDSRGMRFCAECAAKLS